MRLPQNHKRAIIATLGILDEMLCRFEQWAGGYEARGVIYRQSNRLTAEQRTALQDAIHVLRQDLRTWKKDLRLEAEVRDISSAIWSQSSAFWDAIIELGPKYLRRYGELPEPSAAYLDQRVGELADHVRTLTECLGKKPK
jgi:hypothetical protein